MILFVSDVSIITEQFVSVLQKRVFLSSTRT